MGPMSIPLRLKNEYGALVELELIGKKRRAGTKTCASTTLSNKNPKRTSPRSELGPPR